MIRDEEIISEIELLESNLKKTESELKKLRKSIPGDVRLRAVKHGKGYQYYVRSRGSETNGKMIRRSDGSKAETLAQIEYDEKLIRQLKDVIRYLKKWKTGKWEDPFQATLNQMTECKRLLVTPSYVSDETYILNWKDQQYEGLGFSEDYPDYYTRQGLRVRSKSEVLIADILDEIGIPFFYEKPLYLDIGMVHPDFTLLNLRERKEIYWEHFGMMDDMDYRNNALLKIRNYESNGFFQYESLIFTFETGRSPLNTREIRRMIKMLKKELGYEDLKNRCVF